MEAMRIDVVYLFIYVSSFLSFFGREKDGCARKLFIPDCD